jgi:hypothetical protein
MGPLCRNPVREPGLRCYLHRGLPEAPPRLPTPTRRTGTGRQRRRYTQTGVTRRREAAGQEARTEQRRRERVRKAADYCADVAYSGWQEAVADRGSSYVSDATWERVFRGRRRKRCKALAQIAKEFLDIGSLASGLLALLGAGDAAEAFAGELLSHIPLPTDAKINCRVPRYPGDWKLDMRDQR